MWGHNAGELLAGSMRKALALLGYAALILMTGSGRAQSVSVTNVLNNHYAYGYPIGATSVDCPTGYNIPAGQYPSIYHLERGHAIHHYDPATPANDYWVYWAHFDSSSYGIAEVAVFKSTTECGPYLLQTNLYTGTTGSNVTDPNATYNTDGSGYGFTPGGWQSRDEIIFEDAATQTYNSDGTVASYASAYLYSASDSLNTAPTSTGATCGYANDSIAGFKLTQNYMGIDQTTSPTTSGANWIFPCTQREAPVLFRAGNYYFLIVSQAAGWYPSQGAYGSSANPLTGFPGSPLNLGNTSTFGGQTSDGIQITGTQTTSYILTLDHLGGADSKNPASNDQYDTGGLFLPVILNSTTGTATLNWEPSFTINNTTGVLTLPTLTDLATSGTATATVYSGGTAPASYAIDGNFTTRWAEATAAGGSTLATGSAYFAAAKPTTSTLCPMTGATSTTTCYPSLVVDLKSVQPVQEIDLSWYMIKGSEPYYTFKVEYSSDDVNWTTLDYTTFASGSNATAQNISAVPFSSNNTYGYNFLPVNFSARYVAVTETSEVVQNNSPSNYGPNLFEIGVVQSTAPASPQPVTVTVTPSSSSPSASSSFTVAVAVSSLTGGQPTPTGYIQLSAPGYTSDTYGLVDGSNTFTIPAGALTGGAETITVSYRPDPSSAPVYGIGTTTGTANVSVSAPAAPQNLAVAQAQPNELMLTWTASAGATSYVVYRSLNNGTSYTQLATATAASYTDTGLTDGSTYCYEVAAVNNAGAGPVSASACNSASGSFPVSNVAVMQNAAAQLTITYTAVANATSYQIQRSAGGGGYATLATTSALTYTDTGLTNGTNYCYTVAAVFSTGTASASPAVCAVVSAAIASVTVNNYSFESPATTTYAYNPAINGTTQPWTFTASGPTIGSGVTTNASGFTAGNSVAPNGTQVGFLQDKGVAYQTISGLTVGTTYRITEAVSQRQNKSGGQLGNPFETRVDGTAIATVTAPQATATYTDYSQTFTATATSHVIGFYGTNALANSTYTDNTVFIDNIRMISYPAAAGTSATPNFLWLVNNTGTLTRTDEQGTTQSAGAGTGGTAASYGGVAVDSNGGVWSVSSKSNLVNYVTKTGASPSAYTDPSLNGPSAIAIDGASAVWVANSGSNTVSVFTTAGVLRGTVTDSTLSGASGVVIDNSGSIWVSNASNNTVDEILGGAAPVAPLATTVTSNTPGAKP